MKRDVRPGGYVLVATFAEDGPDRDVVFVKRVDGMLEPRVVSIGLTSTDRIEILRGVTVGDPVSKRSLATYSVLVAILVVCKRVLPCGRWRTVGSARSGFRYKKGPTKVSPFLHRGDLRTERRVDAVASTRSAM